MESKATKRSCNDCRQQKLRCDVVQSPFLPCTRCRRLGKNCKVETEFRRVEKRDKYAKMQQEINDLKRKLEIATAGTTTQDQILETTSTSNDAQNTTVSTISRQLGEISLSGATVDQLYQEFFTFYHQFLPILDPQAKLDHYFHLSPLLGWSIMMVSARRFKSQPELLVALLPEFTKLLWSTLAELPQPYHTAKALCLICTWPLPQDQSFMDPTYQLSGAAMQIAIQNMLHVSIGPEFQATRHLSRSEQRDRLLTWATSNVIAQGASTIYGLPSQAYCNWTLEPAAVSSYDLPGDLMHQLKVALFCNVVTQTLYCNNSEADGILPEAQRSVTLTRLEEQYSSLEGDTGSEVTGLTRIHVLASKVHLLAFAFFVPESQGRMTSLLKFYSTICSFTQALLDYETASGTLLEYCSNFILATFFSALSGLLKFLCSSLTDKIDVNHGKALFNGGALAASKMSLQKGDLAWRIATRIPQTWRLLSSGASWSTGRSDLLDLRIRHRMNVSHVHDTMLWYLEWVQGQGSQLHSSRPQLQPPALQRQEATQSSTGASQSASFSETAIQSENLFSELELASLDPFNYTDWMVGDWPDITVAPTALGAGFSSS